MILVDFIFKSSFRIILIIEFSKNFVLSEEVIIYFPFIHVKLVKQISSLFYIILFICIKTQKNERRNIY